MKNRKIQVTPLPVKPGVYIFKNSRGHVLYVGKAARLRERVRSYFAKVHTLTLKTQQLVSQIEDIDFIVTGSEQEALLLESNLIKKHQPHFNVRLKDDKSFPYLKVTVAEEWPRIWVTRNVVRDGSRYFGPFASADSVRQTLRLLKRLFPFRSCKKDLLSRQVRPCLNYHIHRCLGPCSGSVSVEDYRNLIVQVILFLEGKQEVIVRELRRRMKAAAERFNFETAARLRDQIAAVEHVIEGQRIASLTSGEEDAIAIARSGDRASVQVFFIRNGKLLGRESFVLEGVQDENEGEMMASFLKQYYASATYIPPMILVQYAPGDTESIEAWLKFQRGKPVKVVVPKRGAKRQLIERVLQNSLEQLQQLELKALSMGETGASLSSLKEELKLPCQPDRIEGYDISNIAGKMAVGSMVVFEKGAPKPAHYRRFRIKTVEGANDYAMIQEVMRRRFHRMQATDVGWTTAPDLVLIDGGKGQLNAAVVLLKELGVVDVPVASIAKEREEVFLPGISDAVPFADRSEGLRLLQRIRDEAHRFALGYHHKRRKQETFASALDAIQGIGPRRKRSLLERFGSVRLLREARVEDIAAVSGMTRQLAERVKTSL